MVLIFGFAFLNLHYDSEHKQNLTVNNTENFNHSVIKIEENKTINEVNGSIEQHILLKENKTTNKTNESPISRENFLKDLSNSSCKKYVFKRRWIGYECKGNGPKKMVCTIERHTHETPFYTKIKGTEEINGKKYVVVESKPVINKTAFSFNKCDLATSRRARHIFKNLSKTCPPQCEKIPGIRYPTALPESTISREYVDIETGKIKIIEIPILERFKLENNTLYKRKEIFQDIKMEHDYNFTDYTECPSEFSKFFGVLLRLHPLYVPGFIKNFKMQNITEIRTVKGIYTECSKDIKRYMKGYYGEKIGLYKCTKHIPTNYIRKTDKKIIMNKTYTVNDSFYSGSREHPYPGEVDTSLKEQNITKRLVWEGIEKVNGKDAYKIVYMYRTNSVEKRFIMWINDKGMLLGIKIEWREISGYVPPALKGEWTYSKTYIFVNESNSCEV